MTSTRVTRKHVETAALQLARELGETSATVHGGSAVNGVSWHVTIGGHTFRVGMTKGDAVAHLQAMADGARMLSHARERAAQDLPAAPAPLVDADGRPVGVVADVVRAGTSRNGNPSWRVSLEDGRVFTTKTDAGVGYSMTNHRPGTRVALTLDGRGRIVAAEDVTQ